MLKIKCFSKKIKKTCQKRLTSFLFCDIIKVQKKERYKAMAKFPINERVKVDSNEHYDFYIMKCKLEWYVEAYPCGSRDHSQKTIAGFTTLKVAKECVASWKEWMK